MLTPTLMTQQSPSEFAYSALQRAFAHFNRELFDNKLPTPVFVLAHGTSYRGMFHFESYSDIAGGIVDEIQINADVLAVQDLEKVLSTLAHEMTHSRQYHFGTPGKGAHNKQWGTMMEEIGLVPSSTGDVGGKRTGKSVSHYVIDGKFRDSCRRLLDEGFDFGWHFRHPSDTLLTDGKWHKDSLAAIHPALGANIAPVASKSSPKSTRVKYTCAGGCGATFRAEPGIHAMCKDCDALFSFDE